MANEYLAVIERFFVLLLGRGLMLSATDVALVQEWYEAQIPADVVCRGLAAGANTYRDRNGPDTPLPAALHRYQSYVEDAVQNAPFSVAPMPPAEQREELPPQTQQSGTEETPLPAPPAWIVTDATDARHQKAYAGALQSFQDAIHTLGYDDAAHAATTQAIDQFVALLSTEERGQLDAAIDERIAPERATLGRRGLQLRRRAILQQELRSRYGLITESEHNA